MRMISLRLAGGDEEVDAVANEASVEVHDLGRGKAVLGAVLGLDDAEADLSVELRDATVHDTLPLTCAAPLVRGGGRLRGQNDARGDAALFRE